MPEVPQVERIRGGWAARGDGWAVHGASKDDALDRFWKAVEKHEEIDGRAVVDEAASPQPK